MPVATESDMRRPARRILALGPGTCWVKGGHLRIGHDICENGRDFGAYRVAPGIDEHPRDGLHVLVGDAACLPAATC